MHSINIHYFQHVPFEGLGCIEDWAKLHHHQIAATRFYEPYRLPNLNEIDWLIVMGGPMGVYDEDLYPWLKEEKSFIKNAIEMGKTVVGICLGSQLVAEALGSEVFKNKEKEIGWLPVELTPEGRKEVLFSYLKERFTVFHWHGDTFDLPSQAKHLAFTEGCKNQAFIYQNKVLGLQFHFEVTENSLKEMIDNGKSEFVKGKYIQTIDQILQQTLLIKENNQMMFNILDKLANHDQ